MRKVEWLKDERGELYVGAGDHTKLYANGIVSARYALNAETYAKVKKSADRSTKLVGKAVIRSK